MKITHRRHREAANLTEAVGGGGKAGLTYETIDSLKDVVQLDKLGTSNALVLAGGNLQASPCRSRWFPQSRDHWSRSANQRR